MINTTLHEISRPSHSDKLYSYTLTYQRLSDRARLNIDPILSRLIDASSMFIRGSVLSVKLQKTLMWRHNGCDVVSNHQPDYCLLKRLFWRRSKKTPKLRATGFCAGIHRWPVNSPHKWPVTRTMFPFDNVIMNNKAFIQYWVSPPCGWITASICDSHDSKIIDR